MVSRHSYIFPVLFQDINDDDCEELEPGSGSIHSGNPVRSHKSKPNSLNLKGMKNHSSRYFEKTEIVRFLLDPSDKKSDGYESPLGYHGVDVEGVALGDSPTADSIMRGMPDFSASTGSLGSGARPMAKQMTVTSPPSGWSGTSWTGGLAQGCAPAFKTSASVNDIPSSGNN